METKSNAQRAAFAIFSYASAIALVLIAWLLTLALQNVVSTAGFIFFYVAVAASTWYFGNWSAALAVILATSLVAYYFLPPVHSFMVDRRSMPVFIEFAGTAVVTGWFSSWRKRAENALRLARDGLQARVEERTAELKQANEQLRAEIAERKRAEDAYYEAQAELARVTRISALGALAASISHEVNQPLAAVVTNADACMMWLSSEQPNLEEARAALDSIVREGTRASDVVRRIRAMFTKGAPEQIGLHLNELIRDVSGLMEGTASRNQVALRIELAAVPLPVRGDRVQLQQIIVNLVQNGIEAMSSVTDRARRLVIRSERQGSNEVLVAVRDTGVGIDPKNQKRVFDAFFTTKGQGMGMGLSISHSVVEAHGGRLWATANEDCGTTMQFTLPAGSEAS